jgi:hypothetical protein
MQSLTSKVAQIVLICAVILSHHASAKDRGSVFIKKFTYYKQTTSDQIWDNFEVLVSIGPNLKQEQPRPSVSLYSYDEEDKEWTESSESVERGLGYCPIRIRYFCHKEWNLFCHHGIWCHYSYTLRKPLIGYDLLKPSGCGKEELKKQPFEANRWKDGKPGEWSKSTLCYMVIVSAYGQSVSQVYPENCMNEKKYIDSGHFHQLSPPLDQKHRNKRSTSNLEISQFKINKKGKFVCKVVYEMNGGSVNLMNNVPSTTVRVYYKPHSSSAWGSYLLDLDWRNYNDDNGRNKYKSSVTVEHLDGQGVSANGCFKCEAQANGVMDTMETC